MKDTVYISGHKNPDTDSICSAIGYAALKNITSNKTYIPIRLGEVNDETKFVLDYFKVEEPTFMDSIKLKVSDLEYSKIEPLRPNVSIKKAEEYLTSNNIDYICVADEDDTLCGLLTISNLNKVYTGDWGQNILFESQTPLSNIIETLDAEAQYINEEQQYFPGNIWIAAMSEENIKKYTNPGDIVIIGDRRHIQEVLIDLDVSLIIMTGAAKMDDELLSKAKEKGITVISTQGDSLSVARELLLSIPISYVMARDNLISFTHDELVKDIKHVMVKTRYRAFPIIDEENHIYGIISRYNLLSKDKKQIIQVDHNEYAQAIDGIEEADIVEVIDHHRVADIQTSYPIFFRNEPVGSTSTIVAQIYFERNIDISKEIAGLLIGGILSDTLIFKSPTCTQLDIEICHKLAAVAGVTDIQTFGREMQKAATKLDGRSANDIFNSDFKEFKMGDMKVGISQMNTLDIAGFASHKAEMINYMNDKLSNDKYDVLLLLLTDIIDEGSLFVAVGMTDIIEASFNIAFDNNEVYVPGILSRKKQVVPVLTKYLTEDQF